MAWVIALLVDKGHTKEQILGYSRQWINRIAGWPRDDKGGLLPPGLSTSVPGEKPSPDTPEIPEMSEEFFT